MTDEQMMYILKCVANKVTSMITWEEDCQSFHPDQQLPMLDLKIHLDKNDYLTPIKYRFYQKQVANRALVAADSTMPQKMKVSVLTEEGSRRLRNTCPSLLAGE